MFETLTGFKNIAKIIRGFEENNNSYNCLFSYEEIWDCHKYRLLGMTLKIKKKKPWGKRYA